MRARQWAFVLASAWVGAVAFCTGVHMLLGCAPAGHVYIPVKHFPVLDAKMLEPKMLEPKMLVDKRQLLI